MFKTTILSVWGEVAAEAIMVDGNMQVTAYADGYALTNAQAANTVILECTQGSRVSVECRQNEIHDDGTNFYTSFSGFLIQAL